MPTGNGFRTRPCHRMPRTQRRVVRHHGSLTRLLRSLCRESFSVQVLSEATEVPTRDEALALDQDPRRRAWVREVILCGDGRPWVRARTVIPLGTLKGPGRSLKQLGNRPLGTALFGNRPWYRTRFIFGFNQVEQGLCPARRSLFRRCGHSLLVTETFLPALWADTTNRQEDYQTIRMDAIRPL